MSNPIKIIGGKLITPHSILENKTLIVRSGYIEAIVDGNPDIPGAMEIDSEGKWVAPGLIDIQINGYQGIDFSDQGLTTEDLQIATKALWAKGITTFLPTVITNSQTNLKRSFTLLAGAPDDPVIGSSIPGFHLEGPYISPLQGYRGAHLEKHIRPPVWEEFSDLQKSAGNKIRLITIAPEVDGAIEFTRRCTGSGVVVSLGHHNAPSEIVRMATDAGASMSTHLGNGCANLIDRHNNPFWSQLADDRLTVTLIADGAHLNPEELQCFYKIKGIEKTILVSDALDLAGLPPGEYIRLEREVILTTEVIKYPKENCLAGAASPLVACVSNMMRYTGCRIEQAIRMATANPAKVLGLQSLGEISEGKRADLILFTIQADKIEIENTILAGQVVFSKK